MATITTVVRWADNTAELARNLKEGLNQIEATRASVEKLVQSLSGEKLIAAAHRSVAAISEIGGATKLTASEAERNFSLIDSAIQKMELTSQTVPESMRAMRTALQEVATAAKNTDDSTTSMGLSFGKLVAGMVSAQAILALVRKGFDLLLGGITDSIKAAGEAEKAHVQLVAALRAQGTALPSVISAYQGYASALQKTTIYQDDALESAAALLVTIGNVMPRDMEKALKATTNLASGLGIDLDTAARTVAKAAEGNTTALRKVGVIMDDTKGKAHDFGEVLDAITAKFGGQAEAVAGTYQGRLAQLANTWNNVQESVGRVITQNATVLEAFKLLNEAIDTNTGELNGNQAINEIVSDTVIATAKAFSVLIEAVDLTQSAYQTLRIVSNEVVKAFLNIGIAALDTATAIGTYTKYVNPVAWTQTWKNGMREIAESSAFLKGAVAGLNADSVSAATSSNVWSERISALDRNISGFTSSLEKTRGKTNELKDVTDGAANAWDRHTVAVGKTEDALQKALPLLQSSALGFKVYIEDTSKLTAMVPNLTDHVNEMADVFADARDHMNDLTSADISYNSAAIETENGVRKIYTAFSTLPNVIAKSTTATVSFGDALRGDLMGALKSVPQTIANAFTGGGGLLGGLQAVGSQVGSALGGAIGKSVSFLGKLGGPIGAAIGSLAGPLIGWLSDIFSGGEEHKINPVREAFVQAAGGLAELNKHAMAATGSLALVQQLLNAKNAEDYKKAIDALNEAFQFQNDAMQTLDATIQKYGFSIEELGPAMQRQNLDKKAAELLQDYTVLTAAGIDHLAIVNRMSDAVNTFVQQSVAMGIEVPAAMRPMLQSFVDQGKLLDANGNVITNLEDSGVHFAETMTEGFAKVVTAIEKLAKAISGTLGTALDGIPDSKDIEINAHYNIPDMPRVSDNIGDTAFASHGGRITSSGVQYMATGGTVLRMMPKGIDTQPIMAAVGEGIVTRQGMGLIGDQGLSAINSGRFGTIQAQPVTRTVAAPDGSGRPIIVQVMLNRKVLAEAHVESLNSDEAGVRRATKRAAAS